MRSPRSGVGAGRLKTGAAVFALLVAGTLPSAPTAAAAIPASFVFGGAGWGHGVGLSQYGAKGMAEAGSTSAQILSHYYTGTTVAPLTDNMDIRVQVHHATTLTANTTGGQMRLRTSATDTRLVPAGTPVSLAVVGTQVRATYGTATLTGTTVYAEWDGTRFYNAAGPAALTTVTGSGGVYRHGRLEFGVLSGQVNAVNVVRLHDEYLYGIGEMPSSWASAALDAQATIARGYALANMSLKSACNCNVYDTVQSQVFTGWSKENETVGTTNYGLRWKAAVGRTSVGTTQGNVVEYQGNPVSTYFFSSSGGRTENSEDAWSAALPYLRSVADPWSLDPKNNPTYAAWTRTLTQATVAGAFGLSDVASIDLSQRTAGGAVKVAIATSSTGATATIDGSENLRTRLGLPSGWVRRPAVRVAGADRWSTSVAVARLASPSGRTVVIVSGQDANLVDGLVAAPLAHSLGGPVLLVGPTIPSAIRAELSRRAADHAIIVGGTGAVSDSVATELKTLGIVVERVSGTDRYSTAAAVAARVGAQSKAAIVASGEAGSLVDALSASGPASALQRPIVLVKSDSVPSATSTALRTLGVTVTTCIGGTGVISESVRTSLPTCSRAGGADRWDTAVVVADAFSSQVPATQVAVTSGSDANLVDALGAGSLGQLVLLAPATAPPASVLAWLRRTPTITRLNVVGGTGAVPNVAIQGMRNA